MIKCITINELHKPTTRDDFTAAALQADYAPTGSIENMLSSITELADFALSKSLDVRCILSGSVDIFDLCLNDNQLRNAVSCITALLEAAGKIDTCTTVVLSAHGSHNITSPLADGISYEYALNSIFLTLEKLAIVAESAGIFLTIENPAAGVLLSPLELRELVDQVNCPYLGICFNPDHAAKLGNPCDWLKILDRHIKAILLPHNQQNKHEAVLKIAETLNTSLPLIFSPT